MTDYFCDYNALIDPEQAEHCPDGRVLQPVTLVLTGQPDGANTPRPAAVTLHPGEARELAFELLALAEHAEHDGES